MPQRSGNDEAANRFKAETGINVYKWDVSSYESCTAGLKQVEADLGPIEVLVNNAGITRDTMFHRMTLEQWGAVINTNLNSLFNMCRPVIEGMRSRKFGRIINISSINGQKGQIGQTNYSAAKAGEIGFTKALAQETARKGITVNCIAPGYIDTEMVQAVPEARQNDWVARLMLGTSPLATAAFQPVRFVFNASYTLSLTGADGGLPSATIPNAIRTPPDFTVTPNLLNGRITIYQDSPMTFGWTAAAPDAGTHFIFREGVRYCV
jgi:NAD(P)-dependent dehydrogenase (short-subunit alcohol dehydrogenase family)